MLLEIHIRDFALLDKVDLSFSKGLNILTGETGAGKSIVIDSVNFILGEKQSKDIIRTGQESAYVEGVFDIESNELKSVMNDNGIEFDDILVISREINQSGRSISRINGRTVTVSMLKQISKYLIDIHGQHEHQSLLNEDKHIDILDSFCGEGFQEIKARYAEQYNELKDIESEIQKATVDEQYRLRRMDLLTFQIQEIEEASLKINEDEELIAKRNVMANSEKIYAALSSVYQVLYEGEEKQCAYDEIGASVIQIQAIEKYNEKLKDIRGSLEEVYYKLEDTINNIRDFRDSIDFDVSELDDVELRLDLINKMKRKYGASIEEILKYYEDIKEELSNIERNEEILDELNKKREDILCMLNVDADKITEIRKKSAEKLENSIEKELKYLGMEKAIFKVEVEERDRLLQNGRNYVYFTMSANPGEPLRPLSKIASGGEMSRIMLAIKSVIADIDSISTLIFDEIDTGISGRTAQSVAEKMSIISKSHQLLCVTHLAQIAAMADEHFKIEKVVNNNVTTTKVYKLDRKRQYEELARILGGAVVTELTRNSAKEMIELAEVLKQKIRKN